MDIEEVAEHLVNGEGYDGLDNLTLLRVVLLSDQLATAVYQEIADRWDVATANEVLVNSSHKVRNL